MKDSRSERVGLAVTKHEKTALEVIARVREIEGAGLVLRETSLDEAVAEYDRILAAARGHTAAGAGAGESATP